MMVIGIVVLNFGLTIDMWKVQRQWLD
jgi:hypothetical protein